MVHFPESVIELTEAFLMTSNFFVSGGNIRAYHSVAPS